jgi:glucose/arabinose dehydrogenase
MRTGRVIAALLLCGIALRLIAQSPLRLRTYASGFTSPLAIVQDPSDRAVQYVVEQGGRIRVVRDGVITGTDFLDLRGAIVSGGEQGLLGLAFPPDASSPRFFVNFTDRSGDSVVARFRRSANNRLVADASSRFDLRWSTGLSVVRQPFSNHNGGHLAFGTDGFL